MPRRGTGYPLLPDQRGDAAWSAVQYHRPDLNEGLVLAFRRPASPFPRADLALCGLDPQATYELTYDGRDERRRYSGKDLMENFPVELPKHGSMLMRYREGG